MPLSRRSVSNKMGSGLKVAELISITPFYIKYGNRLSLRNEDVCCYIILK